MSEIRHRRFPVLAPKYIDRVVVRGSVVYRKYSVFPGYVLTRFDEQRDAWQGINYARGVIGLILADERPVPVDDAAVYELQARCRGGEFIDDMPAAMTRFWSVGQKVNVIAGTWMGSKGAEVQTVWDDQDRIDILISMFGKSWSIPVRNRMIEPGV